MTLLQAPVKEVSYARFRRGQVIRAKVDYPGYGKAGGLAVIEAVNDGRNACVSTSPISAVFLTKQGKKMRKPKGWASFTANQVEVVHESYEEWLKKPKDFLIELDRLVERLALKLGKNQDAAIDMLTRRLRALRWGN